MKTAAMLFPVALVLAVHAWLFGWFESAMNMTEGLAGAVAPGSTSGGAAIVGGPFLIFFVLLCLAVYVGVALAAALVSGALGGIAIRLRGGVVNRSWGWAFVGFAAAGQFICIMLLAPQDIEWIRARPDVRPATPLLVQSCIVAGFAAFEVLLAMLIMRAIARKRRGGESRVTAGVR